MTTTNRLPNLEAIAHFDSKVLLTSQNLAEVRAYQHALAFTVSGIASQDVLKEVYDAMQSAIKNGTSFNDFKKRLAPYLIAKGWLSSPLGEKEAQQQIARRLKTIYHVNKQTAYAAGRWERIQRTKEFLPYLRYMPSNSVNKRDAHKRYYGIIRPVDDPIWLSIFAPNGFGCKCWIKQISEKEAKKHGISEPVELEMETVTNPYTGEKIETPKGVHFSFNHNHDRLTALLKLAEDKHGGEFGERLKGELGKYIIDYAKQHSAAGVVSFSGIVARASEIKRLSADKKGESISEGIIGDKWQQYYDVTLVRYDEQFHKILLAGSPADFAIKDLATDYQSWIVIDIMFTLDKNANKDEFLRSFNKSEKAWEKRKNGIIKHLQKADIIPMYLGHFDAKTRVKLIGFVLSLPKDLQRKIVFIDDNDGVAQ